jgi:hypothetical protein
MRRLIMSKSDSIAEELFKAIREAAARNGQTIEDYLTGGSDSVRDPASSPCYLAEAEGFLHDDIAGDERPRAEGLPKGDAQAAGE